MQRAVSWRTVLHSNRPTPYAIPIIFFNLNEIRGKTLEVCVGGANHQHHWTLLPVICLLVISCQAGYQRGAPTSLELPMIRSREPTHYAIGACVHRLCAEGKQLNGKVCRRKLFTAAAAARFHCLLVATAATVLQRQATRPVCTRPYVSARRLHSGSVIESEISQHLLSHCRALAWQ